MKKKRRRRLRVDRVLLVLFIFIAIIFLIKFIPYTIYNQKVYNKVKNIDKDIVEIDRKYKKLKLYNKTIKLIKDEEISIKIKDKKYSITIDSKNVKKKMSIDVDLYNKKVKYDGFSKNKSYFIESDIIKKISNINIEVPEYLKENNIVDIYGITSEDNYELIESNYKIKKGKVSFKPDKKYSKYFITYVKAEEIKVKDMTVNDGSVINLIVEYVPKNTTVKAYEYTKIGDIFMQNENNEIIAKEAGSGTIEIKHKIDKAKATANIKVKGESKKAKEKSKIEVKDGITYVDGILIANKTYSLPKDYNPGKLTDETLDAFYKMREAASKDDITLYISSGYRSYNTQESLYNGYVKKDGKEKADTYSARPGHSEHQTGLAMDLNIIDSSFEGTPEAIWLEKNCYKYGFIIRYPKGKDNITGYKYEPWHIRYLGKETAEKVYKSGLTLEEYLGIESKYSE